MADRSVISPENIPTVVAVAAVSALLSFAFSIFVYRELKSVTIGAVALDVRAARRDIELERRIAALQERLTALEATTAAAPSAASTAPVLGASSGATPAP